MRFSLSFLFLGVLLTSCTLSTSRIDSRSVKILSPLTAPTKSIPVKFRHIKGVPKNIQILVRKELAKNLPFPFHLDNEGMTIDLEIAGEASKTIIFTWHLDRPRWPTFTTSYKALGAKLTPHVIAAVVPDMLAQAIPYLDVRQLRPLRVANSQKQLLWILGKTRGSGARILQRAFRRALQSKGFSIAPYGTRPTSKSTATLKLVVSRKRKGKKVQIHLLWTVFIPIMGLKANIEQQNTLPPGEWERDITKIADPIAQMALEGFLQKIALAKK